jgi:dolichol-phosphate mannosyltransferase
VSEPGTRPRIAVVTPVYNEEAALPLYEAAVRETLLAAPDLDVSILFVDDGSQDRSWAIIREMCARDGRFRGIRLSRNFGSHVALTAGFDLAEGDAVATLACDLQDPPSVVLELVAAWRSGARVVWARRRTRDDTLGRALASSIFAKLIRRYAMPRGSQFATGSFLLVDRRVADCFRRFREHNRITFALVAWTGFEQASVDYDRKARVAGFSKWDLSRMLKAFYDTLLGFSNLPFKVMTITGTLALATTLALAGYVLYAYFTRTTLPGWSSLALGLSFFFGIQYFMMGIVGEYLHRIYAEVTNRPLYFVADDTRETHAPRG